MRHFRRKLRTIFFNLLSKVIYKFFALQGKGGAGATVDNEVTAASLFLPINPKLIIDVGANKGDYSRALRLKFKDAELHLFEPSQTNFRILEKVFATDSRVTINDYGLSNSNSDMKLFSNEPGSGLGSLTKRRLGHFGIDFEFSESIRVQTFYEYWERDLRKSQIDFIKLDIEGHELSALQGFGEALKSCRLIQFEFGGCNIDSRTFFQDFWYFFAAHEFSLFRICSSGVQRITSYSELDETFLTTNYLAVNDNLVAATEYS